MTYIINYSRMIFTRIVDNQSTIINNRMLPASICNFMALQIDSYLFILCNCKWRCQCHIFRQRDHVIDSFWQLCVNSLCVLIHRRFVALIRKRSDWEQSSDHRYGEDNAEDSFAFSF